MAVPTAGNDVEKLALQYIAGQNVKWYSHSEKQFSSFKKIYKHILRQDPAHAPKQLFLRNSST